MRFSRTAFVAATLFFVAVVTIIAAEKPQPAPGWQADFNTAWQQARELDRPIILHFYATWCGPCRQMERSVLQRPELVSQFGKNFVAVKINSDERRDLVQRFSIHSLPSDIIVAPDGTVLNRSEGFQNLGNYLSQLARIDASYTRSQKTLVAGSQRNLEFGPGDDPANSTGLQGGSERVSTSTDENEIPTDSLTQTPMIGLDEFSPVAISKHRQWRKGTPEFAHVFQGVTYYLADENELREFKMNPRRYAPQLLGCDPVILWNSDRAIAGSTDFGAYFDGELFLFTSAETRQQFKDNPVRYTRTRHVLQTDQIQSTRTR